MPEIDESLSFGVPAKRCGGVSEMRIELLYKDILRALELCEALLGICCFDEVPKHQLSPALAVFEFLRLQKIHESLIRAVAEASR